MADKKIELCGKKCAECKYHGTIGSSTRDSEQVVICQYILQGLGRRNCSIEHCDKYEPIKTTKGAKGENKK